VCRFRTARPGSAHAPRRDLIFAENRLPRQTGIVDIELKLWENEKHIADVIVNRRLSEIACAEPSPFDNLTTKNLHTLRD